MVELDPIEALAATTGIGLITGERKAPVSLDEIERAGKLAQKVAELVASAVNDTLNHRVPPPINVDRATEELNRLRDHGDHVDMITSFPPGYRRLATGYNLFLSQLRDEIAKMVPRQVSDRITGPEVNPAPAYQVAKFLSVLQVIDDPIQVIRCIGAGTLTKKQSAAVKLVYPTLSELITTALVAAIVMRGKQPSWRLNNGLAAWFETTPLPQAMLQRLQDMHVRFAQQKAQQQMPAGPPSDKSPADKTLFDTPR